MRQIPARRHQRRRDSTSTRPRCARRSSGSTCRLPPAALRRRRSTSSSNRCSRSDRSRFAARGTPCASCRSDQMKDGVWTVSAGNAAQGVAFAARLAGVPCSVMVMDTAPQTKLRSIERLGATIVKANYDECWKTVESHGSPRMHGHFVHPFDDDRLHRRQRARRGWRFSKTCPTSMRWSRALGGGGLLAGIGVGHAREEAVGARLCRRTGNRGAAGHVAEARRSRATSRAGQPSFVDGAGGKSVLPTMWPLLKALVDDSIVVLARRDRRGDAQDRRARARRRRGRGRHAPSPPRSAAAPAPERSSPSSPAATSIWRASQNSSSARRRYVEITNV